MKTIDDRHLKIINGKWCLNKTPYTGISNSIGSTSYFKNGKRHRDNDLPAIEYADGAKSWWVNGKLHRDNGLPAYEGEDGDKAWYVNGKQIYSWEQYQKATKCSKEQLVMYILTHGNIP